MQAPYLLLSFRPESELFEVHRFIDKAFPKHAAPLSGESLLREIRIADVYCLAGVLKWCWARLPGGVVTWKAYNQFREQELALSCPQDAFVTIIPKCVDSFTHAVIIFAFFDLMAAIATHGKKNGMGGRKLARFAGTWAFDLKRPDSKDSTSFEDGLDAWSVASDAANHLFYAFLRSRDPYAAKSSGPGQGKKVRDASNFPRPLEALLASTTYPPPPIFKLGLLRVPMVTLTVGKLSATPLVLLQRIANTIKFDNADRFDCEDDFNTLYFLFSDPDSIEMRMTDESLRITNQIIRENPLISEHKILIKETPKFSFDVRCKTWSKYYNHAFVDPVSGELRRPLTNYVYDNAQRKQVLRASAPRQEIPNLPYPVNDDNKTTKLPKYDDSEDEWLDQSLQTRLPRSSSRVSADGLVTAAVSQISIDDFFVWVWMCCNSDEQTEVRRANFGRSLIVEIMPSANPASRRWVVVEEILHPEPAPMKPPTEIVETGLSKHKKRVNLVPVKEKSKKKGKEKGKRVIKKVAARQTSVPPSKEVNQVQQQPIIPLNYYESLNPLVDALAERLQRKLSIKSANNISHDMQTQTDFYVSKKETVSILDKDLPVPIPEMVLSTPKEVHNNANGSQIENEDILQQASQDSDAAAAGLNFSAETPIPTPPPKDKPVSDLPIKDDDTKTIFFTPSLNATDTDEPPLPDLPPLNSSEIFPDKASSIDKDVTEESNNSDATNLVTSPPMNRHNLEVLAGTEVPPSPPSTSSEQRRISVLIPDPVVNHGQSRSVSLEDKPLPPPPSSAPSFSASDIAASASVAAAASLRVDNHESTDDLNYYFKSQAAQEDYDGLLSHDDLKISSQNNSNRNSANMGSNGIGGSLTKSPSGLQRVGEDNNREILTAREPLTIYKNPKLPGQTTSESDLSEIAPKWKPIIEDTSKLAAKKQLSVKRKPVGSGVSPNIPQESPKLSQEQADLAKDINQLVGSDEVLDVTPIPRQPNRLVRPQTQTLDDPRGSKMFGGYDSTGNQIVGLGMRNDLNKTDIKDENYALTQTSSDFPNDFRSGGYETGIGNEGISEISKNNHMDPSGSSLPSGVRPMVAYRGPVSSRPPNVRPPYFDEQGRGPSPGRRRGDRLSPGPHYSVSSGMPLEYGGRASRAGPGSGYFAGSSNGSHSPDFHGVGGNRYRRGNNTSNLRNNLDSFDSPFFGREGPRSRQGIMDDPISRGSVPMMKPRFPQRNIGYSAEFGGFPSSSGSNGSNEGAYPVPFAGPGRRGPPRGSPVLRPRQPYGPSMSGPDHGQLRPPPPNQGRDPGIGTSPPGIRYRSSPGLPHQSQMQMHSVPRGQIPEALRAGVRSNSAMDIRPDSAMGISGNKNSDTNASSMPPVETFNGNERSRINSSNNSPAAIPNRISSAPTMTQKRISSVISTGEGASSIGGGDSVSISNSMDKPLPLDPRWSQVKSDLNVMKQESEKNKSKSRELLPVVPNSASVNVSQNARTYLTGTHAPDDYYDAVVKTVRNPSVHTGKHVVASTVERDSKEVYDNDEESSELGNYDEFMYLRNKEFMGNFSARTSVSEPKRLSGVAVADVLNNNEATAVSSKTSPSRQTSESHGDRSSFHSRTGTMQTSGTGHTYGSFLDMYGDGQDDEVKNSKPNSGSSSSNMQRDIYDASYAMSGTAITPGIKSSPSRKPVPETRTLDPKRHEEKVSRLSIQGIMNAAKNKKA